LHRFGILPSLQLGFRFDQGIKIHIMAALHNRVSRRELKARLQADPTPRTTLSFYQYTPIADPTAFRDELYRDLSEIGVLGRIYVAGEGINAQVSVPTRHLDPLRDRIHAIPGCDGLRMNIAVHEDGKSFFVLDIKVRHQIVADGISDPGFDMRNKGRYVDAGAFNAMTAEGDAILIDMRNHYEYEVGHFRDAIELPSDTFREQLPMAVDMMKDNRDRNIIMYCTGGIRCEKASAWMLHNGFSNVFHLEGGIIHYVNQVRAKGLENRFIGKNFVFDDRLGERVSPDVIAHCHQCGKPCDTHVNCVNDACHLLFIQCDDCREKNEHCCSDECRAFIHLSPGEQKEKRKDFRRGHNIFNKSRASLQKLEQARDTHANG
jgi:UPF0176 protein